MTHVRRLPCWLTEGELPHDQRSQGASALVRGAVGGPPVRIRVRGPRAEPCRPPLPRQVFHPAGPELLVAERDWEPPRPRFAHDQIVGLRVPFADVAVRDRVKQAGGTWNPERRVWQLRYDRVVALGLNTRIVDEPASNSGCPGSSEGNLHADARAPST